MTLPIGQLENLVEELKKRELKARQRLAIYTAIPVLLAVTLIATTALQIAGARKNLEGVKLTLKSARAALVDTLAVLAALDTQVVVLRSQVSALRYSNSAVAEQLRNDSYVPAVRKLAKETERLRPLSAIVHLRADRRSIPGRTDAYKWLAWVDVPTPLQSKIEAVSYYFNHPTFREPLKTASDPKTQYLVEYIGWGCLHNVIVTFRMIDGSSERMDFDMCSAVDSTQGSARKSNDIAP
jgi:hypothetical protein